MPNTTKTASGEKTAKESPGDIAADNTEGELSRPEIHHPDPNDHRPQMVYDPDDWGCATICARD